MTITTRVGKLTVINDWIQKRIPPLSMSHALRNTDSVKRVSERTDYPDETQNSVLLAVNVERSRRINRVITTTLRPGKTANDPDSSQFRTTSE